MVVMIVLFKVNLRIGEQMNEKTIVHGGRRESWRTGRFEDGHALRGSSDRII
jgi:hypothetical protein